MSEGERALKARAFGVAVRGIRGVRGLLLLNTLWAFLCFLSAMSCLALLGIIAWRFEQELAILSPLTWTIGAIAVLSTAALCVLLRESAWVKAFRLQDLVDHAMTLNTPDPAPSAQESSSGSNNVDYALLERMIDRAVSQAMAARAQDTTLPPAQRE